MRKLTSTWSNNSQARTVVRACNEHHYLYKSTFNCCKVILRWFILWIKKELSWDCFVGADVNQIHINHLSFTYCSAIMEFNGKMCNKPISNQWLYLMDFFWWHLVIWWNLSSYCCCWICLRHSVFYIFNFILNLWVIPFNIVQKYCSLQGLNIDNDVKDIIEKRHRSSIILKIENSPYILRSSWLRCMSSIICLLKCTLFFAVCFALFHIQWALKMVFNVQRPQNLVDKHKSKQT